MALTGRSDPPLVTVLMPAYNAADHIEAAARSILEQGVDDLELLVIDDGSTDGGAEVLHTLDEPRIRVVRQPNSGLVAALNRGLDEARGRYLARMDADDISTPGRLQSQLRWFHRHPDGIACGTDYELFGSMTGRVRMPRSDRACRQRLLLAGSLCGASVMMRRDVVTEAALRFDPQFAHAEDYEFYARLSAFGRIGNVASVGYRYRIHPSQVSNRHSAEQQEAHLAIAAAHANRTGVRALPDHVVRDLLWPEEAGVVRTAVISSAAAARAFRRKPGVQTARFCSRRVIEATLAARRR
ncbi:glycosyltransferase family 2 protein [Gordonia polyisoprenivorans]|uniref:glycosyltransferase family 2 protein n=1 Tax=Gordonia polyisoprenivorans TaxID=84595 RepID=UPI000B99D7B5|nr:glycosyltransferase family A protein [Gordonia polyisoprenivorans]OZC30449.1 glycosyl transferase [Gordonia polyisoprenivorans]